MKDIDFDELDRAVSSVLGQKASNDQADKSAGLNPVADTSDDKVTVTSGLSNSLKTSTEVQKTEDRAESVSTQANSGSEKPRAATPLAVKRRGRFMDVVHPSSGAPMSPKPAHVATKLEPLSTETVAPLDAATPSVEQTAEPTAEFDESSTLIGAEPTAMDSDSTTLALENTADEVHPGDHLLEATYEDTEKQEKSDDSTKEEITVTAEDDVQAESEEPQQASSFANSVSQTTPFLADTKVDKRPLGGAVAPLTDPTPEVGVASDIQSAPNVPLPRELQPDVVQVESVQEDDEPVASGPGSKPFATNVEAAPDPQDDGRVEGHPLFDTSTYHEPIAAVPSKSSVPGWLKWLIGLALCLAVGAGVGYFLFTAGL